LPRRGERYLRPLLDVGARSLLFDSDRGAAGDPQAVVVGVEAEELLVERRLVDVEDLREERVQEAPGVMEPRGDELRDRLIIRDRSPFLVASGLDARGRS
jgi:hypothetical protein